jgi:hypothetical protein
VTEDIPPQEQTTKTPIEIAFVNSPFQGAPEPSPIDGMDMATFRNYLTRALEGDETVPASMLSVVQRGAPEGTDGKKKDQEFWERVFWLNAIEERLKEIDRLIDHYNEMADWSHEQAEQARGRMREAGDKLAAIDEFVTGVNDVLGERERTGKLDREKAVELLKTRDVVVGPNSDDASLLFLLKQQRQTAQAERGAWSKQYEQSGAEATVYEQMEKENRAKAEELARKRDEIKKAGYDPQEEAARLKQVGDEYKLDVQYKAADIENIKASPLNPSDPATADDFRTAHTNQTKDQASDFEALASGMLKKEFATAANGNADPTPMGPGPQNETMKVKLGSPA